QRCRAPLRLPGELIAPAQIDRACYRSLRRTGAVHLRRSCRLPPQLFPPPNQTRSSHCSAMSFPRSNYRLQFDWLLKVGLDRFHRSQLQVVPWPCILPNRISRSATSDRRAFPAFDQYSAELSASVLFVIGRRIEGEDASLGV